MFDNFLIFAAIGAVSGFFAGLLGTGGGGITTPLLIIFLASVFAPDTVTHVAVGTSLAIIALTSLPSTLTHAHHAAIEWRIGIKMAAGAVGGAFLASMVSRYIPGHLLNIFLAVFLLRVSWVMFFPLPPKNIRLSDILLPVVGSIIGGLAALLGVGGGAMMVPFLAGRGLPLKKAIGTSAFVGSPLAFFAATGYIISGWNNDDLPEHTIGYVYLPAFLGIAVSSVVFAYVGATATAKLPDTILRRVFGGMAALLALRLLWRAVY